nr:zf-HC2 domain-containing protein [Acidobacteriota bacterium]
MPDVVGHSSMMGEHGECRQAALVATYLDGELETAAAALFEQHARGCAHCTD